MDARERFCYSNTSQFLTIDISSNIACKELKIVHIPQVAQSFQLLKLMFKKASSSKGNWYVNYQTFKQ